MQSALFILNAGSSSLKFSLYALADPALPIQLIARGQIEALDKTPCFSAKDAKNNTLIDQQLPQLSQQDKYAFAFNHLFTWLSKHFAQYRIVAAGHRVVHGADQFSQPVIIDPAVTAALAKFNPLAPLHQPHNIAGIASLTKLLPDIVQVACFDTAFHRSQSALAQAFALPAKLTAYPLKRYGFHGLSYEYIAQVMPKYLGQQAEQKIIVAHLGHGASLCALEKRHSIATTMGFTALDGLPMGTRCGSLDPGIVLYLLEHEQMSIASINELLYQKSGLLGVSTISADVRILLTHNEPQAKFAIDLFIYRIIREIGSLITALAGLNALVFTAGIGEHAAVIREGVCQQLAWLGIKLDKSANEHNKIQISSADSAVSVWVIPTNEELIIAQHTLQAFKNSACVESK